MHSKILKIVSFILFSTAVIRAQQAPAVRTYSFINYNENYLRHSKDSSLTLNFYKKMDELRSGKRNKLVIAHYGGSHIQAGNWGDKLMLNFQGMGNFEGGGIWAFPIRSRKRIVRIFLNPIPMVNGNDSAAQLTKKCA